MMARTQMDVADTDGIAASRFWRWLRIVGLSLALIFLIGVAAGFVAAHLERQHGLNLRAFALLSGIALAIVGCGWLLVRDIRRPTGEEPLTAKERLNRNILIGSGLIGAAMSAVIMIAAGEDLAKSSVFSSAPLPPTVAIVLVLVMGVLVPALSVYWHRSAVDEQEADAYKTGALYGLYVFMIGAPVWWFAWRGGLVPEPNGIAIYFATILTVAVIWIWKKYR